MGRAAGDERASEWTFTESLTLRDVELRERQVLEDGEVCSVSYAHSIQGRETAKITYRELRKVCAYLGVRYYKNRSKDTMTELIAQKKLKGEVPESYRRSSQTEKKALRDHLAEQENRDPLEYMNSPKRQRVADDTECSVAPTITSASPAHAFLQPVSPTASERERRSPSTDYDSGIPTTPAPAVEQIHVDMSLKDRADTFNLLRHVRQQIIDVEEEIATHAESDVAQISSVKTKRLTEDLQFYLSERQSLMQQLECSRAG
ncbi:unnamed protein product [Phytophthora lilii]|uniref:Unnamed protein product n=1 Tax=Phytophthora lilii TaxID=2077276 RepID=A0A9W6WHW5_9STRA|nr:unnamed protein product [Phytophthora lilii]